MPQDPLKLHQVLAHEYQTLRPESDFASAGEAGLFAALHKQEQPLSALCISGGGIRSATFALGAIQGLAAQGLLNRFDYLSTVSGGGYIGGWLSAWIHRFGGLEHVIPHLRPDATPPHPGEPDPIEHLREYNNYLSPRLGFFSADTWTLAATVGRNILLNWLVIIPLFMAALMIPRLLLAVARLGEAYKEIHGTADPIATHPAVVFGLPIVSGLLLAMSIFNTGRYLPGVGARDHSQGDFLAKVLAPLVLAALCFSAFDSLYFWGDKEIPTTIPQLITWILVPSSLGWLAFLVIGGRAMRRDARGLIGPLSIGVLLMSVSSGIMAWFITNKLLPPTSWAEYVTIAPPLLVLAFDLGGAIFMGLASNALEDEDREWLARASAWTQLFCVSWLGVCGLVLLVPGWAFEWKIWAQSALTGAGVLSGWLSTLGGAPAGSGGEKPAAGAVTRKYVQKLAPAVFILTLVIGLSALTNFLLSESGAVYSTAADKGWAPVDWWDHDMLLEHTPWFWVIAGGAILYAVSWLMARYININKFSLHGMYRNRLIRAYLGASNPKRNASRFTGFAESDNLRMSDLRTGFKPFHVVNLALNVVSGERLAWQQRKAQCFSVSPLYCGNFELGYRDSAQYGNPNGGITLGTAVTISGAAASPNMGYHSSPIIGLIMTLLNARLGAWLGNPGVAGNGTWTESGPRTAIGSLVKEAFGLTTNTSAYVYLSDGGHFENLALYTMVLRRCRYIVVLDSGCDPKYTYEDLGNALRKIRIDLKIPIEFADDDVRPLRDKKKRCAVARIRYSEVDGPCEDGVLLYIKPILLGNEPPDVESYAAAFPAFPHQSTGDQWFNESQTESYRMLGLHTVEEICRGWDGKTWASFAEHATGQYLQGMALPKSKGSAAIA